MTLKGFVLLPKDIKMKYISNPKLQIYLSNLIRLGNICILKGVPRRKIKFNLLCRYSVGLLFLGILPIYECLK